MSKNEIDLGSGAKADMSWEADDRQKQEKAKHTGA